MRAWLDIWVRAGANFHAGHELEAWIRPPKDYDHAEAAYTCVLELADIRRYGFALRKKSWRREGFDEVWTFMIFDYSLAAAVPGDGRGDSRDLCLIASGKTGTGLAGRQALLATVRHRMANGAAVRFPL